MAARYWSTVFAGPRFAAVLRLPDFAFFTRAMLQELPPPVDGLDQCGVNRPQSACEIWSESVRVLLKEEHEYHGMIYRREAWILLAVAMVMEANGAVPSPANDKLRYSLLPRSAIEARLGDYKGDDAKREAALKREFSDAGCDAEHLAEQRVKGTKLPNVICTLPGQTDEMIIVGAHFDHIARGDGVVDNWSGASMLPSLYESLKNTLRKHTYIFIGFTDEERGEVGSHFYAQQMKEQEVARTEAMVNMDTLGLGPSKVWLSHSDKELAGMLAAIAKQLKLPISAVNVEQVGSTDSVQFSARNIPSITIHTLTQESWDAHILHTEKDKMTAIRLEDYYQSYQLISAYLAALDVWLPLLASAPKPRQGKSCAPTGRTVSLRRVTGSGLNLH